MKKAMALLALSLALPTASLAAGDAEAGKGKVAVCIACHGADGKTTTAPIYPKLAGQNAAYLELALKAYRDKQRNGGNAAVMTPMAASLSDQDIADISAFYAAQ